VAEPSDLLITPRERGSRYVKFGVLGALVAGLVVALVVLLPPLIHQDRGTQSGAPQNNAPPPPPPGACAPPIGPPPDLPRNPPGGPPRPPPGVPGPGQPCPGPPTDGQGYHLQSKDKQVDVVTVAITSVEAEADLSYQPCGPHPILRHAADRPFGAFAIYPATGKACQTSAHSRPLQDVVMYAPNLSGYCMVLADNHVVHILVQAWGDAGRPNLRLQITTWAPANASAT
jgi:hypothetical protein